MRRLEVRPGWVLWCALAAALPLPAEGLADRPAIVVRGVLTEGRFARPQAERAADAAHRAILEKRFYDSFPAAKGSSERVVRFRGRTTPGSGFHLLQESTAHTTVRPGTGLPHESSWRMDRSPRRFGKRSRDGCGSLSPN